MATGGNHGTGKTEWPKTREEFVEWFWLGVNGNELIKELNCSKVHGNDYIRREIERPRIYGIVLNDGSFPRKEGGVQWKLCKVGFTHASTGQGTQNRMEQVQAQIKAKYESTKGQTVGGSVLFVLPVGAVDVTTFSDTEKRIRNAVGWPIHKDFAKKLKLPCSTEWVLTTQQFIDIIKLKIKRLEVESTTDCIDLFKNLKFKYKEPSWVNLKDVDKVRTVMHWNINGSQTRQKRIRTVNFQ